MMIAITITTCYSNNDHIIIIKNGDDHGDNNGDDNDGDDDVDDDDDDDGSDGDDDVDDTFFSEFNILSLLIEFCAV